MLRRLQRLWLMALPVQIIMIMGAVGLIAGVSLAMLLSLLRGGITPAPLPGEIAPAIAPTPRTSISRVFTQEVQFWAPFIMRWSKQYGVDPDILATVIQIESCGHYLVNSPAGAQGLFQVMPFHFSEGENMLDPETNAKRGIAYLIEGLKKADGHIGLAMAGYNGGHGVIGWGWARWAQETRNYYIWGSGIYLDAIKDKTTEDSTALQSWLRAGGINLCRRAADILATLAPGTVIPRNTPASAQPLVSTAPAIQPVAPTDAPAPIAPVQPVVSPSPTLFIPPVATIEPTPFRIPPTITPPR